MMRTKWDGMSEENESSERGNKSTCLGNSELLDNYRLV